MPKGFVKKRDLELALDSKLANASVARREVGAFAHSAGFDEESVQAARAVVTEAFTNAASHAYEEEGPIEIEAGCDEDCLRIVVRDYGSGIRPSPLASAGHGRLGLLMIAALADLCQIRHLRPQGTEITAVISPSGSALGGASGDHAARSLVA